MKWTPREVVGGVLLLVITGAAIAFLPAAPAWSALSQIAVAAAKGVFGS